jgi:hypothetical protein
MSSALVGRGELAGEDGLANTAVLYYKTTLDSTPARVCSLVYSFPVD